MKTDKFTQSNEAFTQNASNSMKWFQDYSAFFMDMQAKQFTFATQVFNNALTSSFAVLSTTKMDATSDAPQKVTELINKNMETLSALTAENMKTVLELNAQANSTLYSKEAIQQAVDSYTKQVEAITEFNQSSLESLTKQFDTSRSFANPFTESLKTQFETNTQLFNDTIKQFTSSFGSFTQPSADANKNIFMSLYEQMGAAYTNNMKLWSDLMNKSKETVADFNSEPGFNTSKKAEQKEPQNKGKLQAMPA